MAGFTPKISIRNLNVYYGQAHTLKNITVDIPDNAITAIIGPSGCGKSTLLKSVSRLLEISDDVRISGSVEVDGEDIYAARELTHIRKKMGLLSQRPTALPMSIRANVTFGMRLHKRIRKKRLAQRVEHYLKLASLWDEVKDRLDESASKLSIGQRQRLCLARGLAVQPEIILADEPTSALDPMSSQHIEQIFMNLKSEYAIIHVTHILRQARRLADYVIFMYYGEIIEHGPAEQVLDNPQHERTKEYVKGLIS